MLYDSEKICDGIDGKLTDRMAIPRFCLYSERCHGGPAREGLVRLSLDITSGNSEEETIWTASLVFGESSDIPKSPIL